jgi:hypothetical protein
MSQNLKNNFSWENRILKMFVYSILRPETQIAQLANDIKKKTETFYS